VSGFDTNDPRPTKDFGASAAEISDDDCGGGISVGGGGDGGGGDEGSNAGTFKVKRP
jgi:hypothetical protein